MLRHHIPLGMATSSDRRRPSASFDGAIRCLKRDIARDVYNAVPF